MQFPNLDTQFHCINKVKSGNRHKWSHDIKTLVIASFNDIFIFLKVDISQNFLITWLKAHCNLYLLELLTDDNTKYNY